MNRYCGRWPANKVVKKFLVEQKFEKEGISMAKKTNTSESIKLREILNSMGGGTPEDRKKSNKFVDEFKKENGKIKYFKDQWVGTKVWNDAYKEGESQGDYLATEYHKEIIYRLVKQMTMDIKNAN